MLCKKVYNYSACRRQANQEQAKHALTSVLSIQLAPSYPGILGRRNSNALK